MDEPTYIAIRSRKQNKSLAVSHQEHLWALIETNNIQGSSMKNGKIKPLYFVSIDGGPDKAPIKTLSL